MVPGHGGSVSHWHIDEERKNLIVGTFTLVFVSAIAVIAAAWLVVALLLGSAVIVERWF